MTKGRKSKGGVEVSSASAHYFVSAALSSGSTTIAIVPSGFGSSIQSISDGFALFRVKSLRFRIFAFSAGASVGCVTSYTGSPPVTRATVMESPDAVDHEAGAELTWSRWVRVRKVVLTGMIPWYKTRAGSFDPTEYTPCFLALAGTGSNIVNVEIMAVFQFKDPISTASTPLEKAISIDLRTVREYDDACSLRWRTLMSMSGAARQEDIDPKILVLFPPPPPPVLKVIDYDKVRSMQLSRGSMPGFVVGSYAHDVSNGNASGIAPGNLMLPPGFRSGALAGVSTSSPQPPTSVPSPGVGQMVGN